MRTLAMQDYELVFPEEITMEILPNHKIKNVRIGSCGGVVNTQRGEVMVVLHEYAILGKGQTIHSSGQMEHHRNAIKISNLNAGHPCKGGSFGFADVSQIVQLFSKKSNVRFRPKIARKIFLKS